MNRTTRLIFDTRAAYEASQLYGEMVCGCGRRSSTWPQTGPQIWVPNLAQKAVNKLGVPIVVPLVLVNLTTRCKRSVSRNRNRDPNMRHNRNLSWNLNRNLNEGSLVKKTGRKGETQIWPAKGLLRRKTTTRKRRDGGFLRKRVSHEWEFSNENVQKGRQAERVRSLEFSTLSNQKKILL